MAFLPGAFIKDGSPDLRVRVKRFRDIPHAMVLRFALIGLMVQYISNTAWDVR